MRKILSDEYIPFGTQYYRAPSPHPEDWERDLKAIADGGLNMVKYWVQWRWNHPEEDRFHFDDIDRLMDLAQENGLKVMLNTIFDVAPSWIYRKYPDASMITRDGRQIGPQTQPHRQVGGLGYCFNHRDVTGHQFRFLQETVRRYSEHPALAIWNVGSEPELTSSMAEMRVYAEDAEKMGDMLCYCQHCQMGFRKWLVQKYETVERLNESWNRNYADFDEVEIPLTRNTFNDMIDWRLFFVHTLGENVRRRFEVAQAEDAGRHPLMCHHVFIQGFPITSTANDPWNVGQYGDLHGCTQMDDASMVDVLRSCAKDKPVISAEMLMMPGYTLELYPTVGAVDIKRFIFTGIAANLKGFIFWQYRPEILGREAPTWGLTQLDGGETARQQAYYETGKVLQDNAGFLLDAEPAAAEIALLYAPENQIFTWAATGNEKDATDALLGAHRALYEKNFQVDFIHPLEFESGILDHYKVIIVPFPYCLPDIVCRRLDEWVKSGGVLIGESHFAAWNLEHGHHEKTVPGHGMDSVFQARQVRAEPAGEEVKVTLEVAEDLPYIHRGEQVSGSIVKEILEPEGARVLARYDSGESAITYAEYGQGKAILCGTYLATPFHREKVRSNGNLIASLAAAYADVKRTVIGDPEDIRVDTLMGPSNTAMVIVQNLSSESIKSPLSLDLELAGDLTEQFTGETLQVKRDPKGKGVSFTVDLAADDVKVYRG